MAPLAKLVTQLKGQASPELGVFICDGSKASLGDLCEHRLFHSDHGGAAPSGRVDEAHFADVVACAPAGDFPAINPDGHFARDDEVLVGGGDSLPDKLARS